MLKFFVTPVNFLLFLLFSRVCLVEFLVANGDRAHKDFETKVSVVIV